MYSFNFPAKRNELNTLPDNGRKKQPINVKDNFWPVTGRSKGVLDMWFRDLAGTKPLVNLAKKAPSFNKKEEIFTYLCDHQVSMKKAMWFLKLSAAYTTTVTEQKIKKRQMPDPSIEWTATVIRVMKDLSQKLVEHYTLEKSPKVINAQAAIIGSPPSTNAKCNRCSIDKQLTPTKCTKDKGALINKEKSSTADGKPATKVKSLREKVLNRSLLKNIRLRELKLTKRKASALGSPPAKRAKSSLRVTRIKTVTRIKRESAALVQPGSSDANPNPDLATDIAGVASTVKPSGDDSNSADVKDRGTCKLVRKRLAMRKRYGLPSISQIIADLLAKRAKKRAKQRLNEKSAEQNANQQLNSEDGDTKNGTTQPSTSPSATSSGNAVTTNTSAMTPTRSNQSSSKLSMSSGKQPFSSASSTSSSSQQQTNAESPTTGTGFSNFSSSGRETPNVSATSASSNSSSSSSSSSSSNHTFITPAVPTTPGTVIEDFPTILRHWKYCTRLCKAMCEESLLDRHEFLQWALELLDRMRNKTIDDGFLKLFLPFIMQCLPYIVESERLSRRLAYLVCKKIGFMLHYVTEEDTIAVNMKKPPPQSSSSSCCDANITNRLDASLKIKQEPEIRAPLSTRSASTRYKKIKMDPPTPPPLSAPASPSTASLDSPEDLLSTKSLLGSNYLPNRPSTNPDRKSFGARPYSSSSTSPASKQLSASQTPPAASPPTASPPSISSNTTSLMPIGATAVQPVSQSISTKNQSLGVIKHRQKPSAQFMETMLRDFLLCEHHRPIIMELSAMIQAITLRCPGALVWCGLSGKERDSITPLAGGPLEYMPVLPSQLPMPSNNRRHNELVRKRLREVEQQIVERSKHSEKRWVADKWLRKTIDGTINEVILNTLSILDAHGFDRLDGNNNNLASLYSKLFQPVEKVMKQVRISSILSNPKIPIDNIFIALFSFRVLNRKRL